jgi:hypothetical protein
MLLIPALLIPAPHPGTGYSSSMDECACGAPEHPMFGCLLWGCRRTQWPFCAVCVFRFGPLTLPSAHLPCAHTAHCPHSTHFQPYTDTIRHRPLLRVFNMGCFSRRKGKRFPTAKLQRTNHTLLPTQNGSASAGVAGVRASARSPCAACLHVSHVQRTAIPQHLTPRTPPTTPSPAPHRMKRRFTPSHRRLQPWQADKSPG